MHATDQAHRQFCENLRAARKRAGLTQVQAAEKLGWKQATWGQYETGVVEPGLGVIVKLAGAVGVPPRDLLDPGFASNASAA